MKKSLLLLGAIAGIALTGCKVKSTIKVNPDKEKYVVGIAQYAPHVALDAATEGFKEKLTELLTAEGRQVEFREKNASGTQSLCTTIVNDLVSYDVDLIMANATPCVAAAYQATSVIPILGTSVTEYGVALNIEFKDGKSGTNVSGTSDLAPLDQQVEIMTQLNPSARKFGIVYNASEPNSKFQADEVAKYLKQKNLESKEYVLSDASTISSICGLAASEMDVIYIPTDNFCANNVNAINAEFAGRIPVFAGEEGICKGCGFATLSIDYKELGKITGEMAFNVLLGKQDIREYAVKYDEHAKKKYVKSRCEEFGITIPTDSGYEELVIE